MTSTSIDAERLGEIAAVLAHALIRDTSPEERLEILRRWNDVGQYMPVAVEIINAIREGMPDAAELVSEAMQTFGKDAALQFATRLRRKPGDESPALPPGSVPPPL